MLQRLFIATKWMWCFFILSSGSWSPVNSVSVPTPPSVPATIEAQAKFFQDFFSVQLSPYNIEFGHVCEDPNTWEQRYEKKDFKNHRDMGKVRWGDKKGGYGEHYWDLNHAGHADDHGSNDYDDGSYHEDPHSNYEYNESNEQPHKYEADDYNPEDTTHFEENGRAKRAHTKSKPLPHDDKITETEYKPKKIKQEQYEEDDQEERRNFQEELQRRPHNQEERRVDYDESDEDEVTYKPLKLKPKKRTQEQNNQEIPQKREKNHIVLVVNQRQKDTQEDLTTTPEPKRFVPYEGVAGVRQHVQPEVAPTAVPRLFLNPATGHIIDKATGQAYILQPINHNIKY